MMQRKKITEIVETYRRTVEKRGKDGKLTREYVDAKRVHKIQVVPGGQRIGHYLIDGIIIQLLNSTISYLLFFLFWGMPYDGTFFLLVGSFPVFMLVMPAYYFIFETFFQQTIGKMVTRTYVINAYAEKPGADVVILRTLVRLIPFEALSCFSDQGWHDRFSETWVVKKEEMEKLRELLRQDP